MFRPHSPRERRVARAHLARVRSTRLAGDSSAAATLTRNDRSYKRMGACVDQCHHDDAQFPVVRIRDQQTGEVRSLSDVEEAAFWEWSCVEVLRHSGIRAGKLVELAHTGIRQYASRRGMASDQGNLLVMVALYESTMTEGHAQAVQ